MKKKIDTETFIKTTSLYEGIPLEHSLNTLARVMCLIILMHCKKKEERFSVLKAVTEKLPEILEETLELMNDE